MMAMMKRAVKSIPLAASRPAGRPPQLDSRVRSPFRARFWRAIQLGRPSRAQDWRSERMDSLRGPQTSGCGGGSIARPLALLLHTLGAHSVGPEDMRAGRPRANNPRRNSSRLLCTCCRQPAGQAAKLEVEVEVEVEARIQM